MSEPTQEQLDAFILRAGFRWGWENVESAARMMARQAVAELNALADSAKPAGEPDARIHLENIYAFLCSVAPEGIADEAFRNVPEALFATAIRDRISEQRQAMGPESGAVSRHDGSADSSTGSDGKAVDALAAAPAPAEPAEPVLSEDDQWTLTCAVENMRLADPSERAIEARWNLAWKIGDIVKRAAREATR